MYMDSKEYDRLLAQYQDYQDTTLDRAIDGILALKASGEISEDLSKRAIGLLVRRHISLEIRKELQDSDLDLIKRGKRLRFMGIQYGRTEEHFAV